MKALASVLSIGSMGGLGLIALGILPWGARAIASFTLLGFAWIFILVIKIGVHFHQQLNGGEPFNQ